jgi:hypothetical protein
VHLGPQVLVVLATTIVVVGVVARVVVADLAQEAAVTAHNGVSPH